MFCPLKFIVILVMGITTDTTQDAVNPRSTVLAVIVALPGATPLTAPLLFTVAILLFEVDQVTALLAALAGRTVIVSVLFCPTFTFNVVLFKEMEVTG